MVSAFARDDFEIGNGCGYNTTTKDFPYLYWPAPNFNINTSSTNYQDYMAVFKYSACVRECPSGDNKTLVQCIQPKTFEASAPKKFANCEYYPAGTSYNYKFRYETKLVIGRYCLPSSEALADEAVKAFNDNFYNKYDVDKYSQYIGDLYKAWYVMAISVGVAVVAAMVYLIILRWFAGVLIWVSIVGILAALGGGGYWAYQTRLQYDIEDKNYKYLQYGAYALWGVTGAFAILVLLCCSRIRLAVAIMKVTSSFITNNPLVLLLPIIFLLLVLAWIIVWTFLAVFIMSVGEIKPRDAPF